jgi:hypothetical protein
MPGFIIQYDIHLQQIRANGFSHQTAYAFIISKSEDISVKNSPAEQVPTTSPEDLDSTTKSLTSLPQLQHASEQEEPSAFSTTTSSASIVFLSDEEYFSPPVFEMNHNHEMILDNIRRGDEWHQNLQRVHGFTEAESCECLSRTGK